MANDVLNRPLRDLRISVTDRCNFRCSYCMPLDRYDWVNRREILSFEEIRRLSAIFISLGVTRIRLTGGEPLLRRDLHVLVADLSRLEGLEDITLTTNGSLLLDQVAGLRQAGLKRINISIDTLDPEKFERVTQRGKLDRVLDGVFAAKRHGLNPIKINAVIERGFNDDEIIDLVDFGRIYGFPIRFIEFMDVGNANNWSSSRIVSKAEILSRISARFPVKVLGRIDGSAPAVDYAFDGSAGGIGIVASVTEPFCSTCTRARLTADGKLVTCLFARAGCDLKPLLRGDASDDQIREILCRVWEQRKDKYSQERLEALSSGEGYNSVARRKIEMISLGG